MGYITELNGDFYNSPSFKYGMTYNKEFDSIDSMLNDGNYYDRESGFYIRPINTVYNEQTGVVPFVLKVEQVENTVYARTMGVYTHMMYDDVLFNISYGLGAKFDKASNEFMQMYQDFSVSGIADMTKDGIYLICDGVQNISANVVEWVNDYILHKYGETPINTPYYTVQKTYPEGEGFITDWDNSKIADTLGGIQYNTQLTPYFTPENMIDNFEELAENDDELKDILSNYQNVRIFFATGRFPSDVRIYVNGYSIANSSIVTTNETDKNQHYGVRITKIKGVKYETSTQYYSNYPTLNKVDSWSLDTNIGITLYNYPKSGWWSTYGTGDTEEFAVLTTGYVVDLMGEISERKPYAALPQGGLWTKNPDDTYPLGEPEETTDEPSPTPPSQDPVRHGTIPKNNPVPIVPVIGVPPIPKKDDPTTPMKVDVPTPDDGGLYHIHKLDSQDLKDLSNYLWDRTIIEQLKELWTNNPLDGVISLHQVYYDVETLDTKESIMLGYLSTGANVQAYPVIKRYQEINFGSLKIDRTFNNIRDYQKEISIYLPFIGLKQLEITDFVGCTREVDLNLRYIVDNLTGDCVATIYVNKDGNQDNKILYTFSGNCASQLPLSSADRTQLISSAIGGVGNVISSVVGGASRGGAIGALGGALGGVASGAMGMLANAQVDVEKCGNISGNVGAMSYKDAFIIINSPIPFDAQHYNKYGGYSSNIEVTLRNCQGFTRMSECIINNLPCTTQEIDMIKRALRDGVIV